MLPATFRSMITGFPFVCTVRQVVQCYAGVGKTCLSARFKHGSYAEQGATIFIEFIEKSIVVKGYNLRLSVWDTAGDIKQRNHVQSQFRGKPACIVAYDVTDRETFARVPEWVEKLNDLADPQCVIYIVGTKCDLKDKKVVSTQEGEQLAQQLGIGFIEVSSKTGENVENVFTLISEKVLMKILDKQFDLQQTSHGITRHGFNPKTEKITKQAITKKTEDTSICGKLFSMFSSK